MNCKGCGKEIPANHVQQGGFHMGCDQVEVTIYKFNPRSHGSPVILEENELGNFLDNLRDSDFDETWEITKTKMKKGVLDMLPEHTGW